MALGGCNASASLPAEPPVDAGDDTRAALRTLTSVSLRPTSPHNLLLDPEFVSLTGTGHFAVFEELFFTRTTAATHVLPLTPAGPRTAVLHVIDASKPKSVARLVAASWFPGGKGPFAISAWVSPASFDLTAVALPADPTACVATVVALGNVNAEQAAYDLPILRSERKTVDGRVWLEIRGTVDALPGGGVLLIRTAAPGWILAAPQVVPQALDKTTSGAPFDPASERGLTPLEQRFVTGFVHRDMLEKPRLLPEVR